MLSTNILVNRSDYHMTIGWEYGVFVEGRSFVKEEQKKFMRALKRAKNVSNEIVFHGEISLEKYLAAVWIGSDVDNAFAADFSKRFAQYVPIIKTTKTPSGEVIDLTKLDACPLRQRSDRQRRE